MEAFRFHRYNVGVFINPYQRLLDGLAMANFGDNGRMMDNMTLPCAATAEYVVAIEHEQLNQLVSLPTYVTSSYHTNAVSCIVGG
jgi:hypothetical protein